MRLSIHFIRHIRPKFGILNSAQAPDIGQNSDGGISDFQISDQSFIKENCHNSRTSNDIDIKLGPVTKLGKQKTATSKTFAIISCQQTFTSLSFFRFMANLEQSGSRIPDALPVKFTSSLLVTFYLTRTENRTKTLKHSSRTIALTKGTIFAKNC